MGGTSSSLQARGITEIKVREGVRWGWPCFQCTPTCVCLCVCVCKTVYSLGYYYHNPTYVFSPVYMISNVFSIAVYVSLDIKMLYSKIDQELIFSNWLMINVCLRGWLSLSNINENPRKHLSEVALNFRIVYFSANLTLYIWSRREERQMLDTFWIPAS